MTMPATTIPARTIELPPPGFPMLMVMFTDNLVPDNNGSAAILWNVSKPHPFVPDMKVMRMFVDRGGVEVYSVSDDGKIGMRDLVPMDRVRLIQEAMPLDVFIDELALAESGDEDDLEPEPEPEPEPAPAPVNGQATPS